MTTLSIQIGPSGTGTTAEQDEKIVISHFKFYSVAVEQAREGLRQSPGIVVVMSHPGCPRGHTI